VQDAEKRFAEMMPGVPLKGAKRTPRGYPFVEEVGEFEPGTYGQRLEGIPKIRVSPKAQPWERRHEIEHVDQLYGGGVDQMDQAYLPGMRKLRAEYMTSGLTPDDAEWMVEAGRPSELAARTAAGDPDLRYKELMAKIEQMRARRLARTSGR
jgi:hypothetical protein